MERSIDSIILAEKEKVLAEEHAGGKNKIHATINTGWKAISEEKKNLRDKKYKAMKTLQDQFFLKHCEYEFCNYLLIGRKRSGKSLLAVKLIEDVIRETKGDLIFCGFSKNHQFDKNQQQIKIILKKYKIPSVWKVAMVEKFRGTEINHLEEILERIREEKLNGNNSKYIFYFDDLGQNNRLPSYENLLIQNRHLGITTFTMTQSPQQVSPGSINNTDTLIMFEGTAKKKLYHINDYSNTCFYTVNAFRRAYQELAKEYKPIYLINGKMLCDSTLKPIDHEQYADKHFKNGKRIEE